ncbi:probable LRR receptor-like serine/threonine-protein kinase At3g47570 isoform X2 [Salvia splendens]|uniref:probable LRR receptor-like serine/threonine-protein kinase At3g47570 isoform X2 n=1 Tax=Salvia splendens TaxID=180675 RepID=UPI001C2635C3|nr:probable LRR receptor-like serine/threonine-protein kinase At3g47570 isoform X2 [Salvia splendens]
MIPQDIGNLSLLEVLIIPAASLTGNIPSSLFNISSLKYVYLYNNSLSGNIPSNMCDSLPNIEVLSLWTNQLSGEIPPNIWKCTHLQDLELSVNHFNGKIPSEIGSLSMLRDLWLGYNDFRVIPEEIGNLSQLETLSIPASSLTGNIPSSVLNISSLKFIDLSNNTLSGNIPTFHHLPKLEELYLFHNNFEGWLPSDVCSSNMSNIKTLELYGNQLQGPIPPNIWKCTHLEILALSDNNLSGNIPFEIGNMSMLKELYLSGNNFQGGIPAEIGKLTPLEVIDLANASLTGNIPTSIFNISTLTKLSLGYNNLSGTLSSDMGISLLNLELLYVDYNRLTGPIPSTINNASKLIELYMDNSFFIGSIPDLGNLKHLQELFLNQNHLIGEESSTQELTFLSSLTKCRNLKYLVVSDNSLNGILPASIGNFSSSLQMILLQNSHIVGVIPSEIGNLSSLLSINLGGNQLRGPIPPFIGNMKKLQRLYLYGNKLEGSIPNDVCRMNNLGELILDRNMLVGSIPKCLGEVQSLREIYLGYNQLNSTIPPNFWNLTDLVELSLSSNHLIGQLSSQLGNLKSISYLDLSSNQFSGNIPSSIGGCESLESLYLSNNLLDGSIPQSLANVRNLKALDLSYNNLSGSIPKSLEDLRFLEYFNVSNNKLVGEIPDRGCFGNLSDQSFSNNLALCGPIRLKVPPCTKNHHRSKSLLKFIVPSVILAVTMVIVVLVFINKFKPRKSTLLPTAILPVTEYRRVSYIELERGTNGFSESNLLGKGSFGSVFEATLSDGLKVAVKVFNMQLKGAEMSFNTETEILGSIRHRNIVRVIGCCSSPEFKALVLTYMPNGNLDKWLYSNMLCLVLIQRLKIAIDVAAALDYLHHGHSFPVVHRDIKPSNVLLDEDMVAHLGDFGIGKLFDDGEVVVQTQTLATIGYAAPELGMEGKVSTHGDVYSFGIMLLEMFTGKKPTDDMFDGEMRLKEWVSESIQENSVPIAPAMLSSEDQDFCAKEQCVLSIYELAMKCLATTPHERINMIEAANTLQRIYATMVTERRHPRYAFSIGIPNNGL